MHLKSNIALTYNDGLNGTKTTIVAGEIENTSRDGECTVLGANFAYSEVDANGDFLPILKGSFLLEDQESIQTLYDKIKASLPATLPADVTDEPLQERTKYYLAFREEMVATFLPLNPTLTVADIDIIS